MPAQNQPHSTHNLQKWQVESSAPSGNDLSAGLRFVSNTAHTGAPSAAHRERQPNSGPPAPIRPVGGSQMVSSTGGYHEGMSQRDYNAWRDSGGGGGGGRR
jgi:hypothetical protein